MCGGGIAAGDRRNHLDSFFVSQAPHNNTGAAHADTNRRPDSNSDTASAHANTNRRPDSDSDTNPSTDPDPYPHPHASAYANAEWNAAF
jgi:hypothetical protein